MMTSLFRPTSRTRWLQRLTTALAMACVVFTSFEAGITVEHHHENECVVAGAALGLHADAALAGAAYSGHCDAEDDGSGSSGHASHGDRQHDHHPIYLDHCAHSHALYVPPAFSIVSVTTLIGTNVAETGEFFYDSIVLSPQQRPPIS